MRSPMGFAKISNVGNVRKILAQRLYSYTREYFFRSMFNSETVLVSLFVSGYFAKKFCESVKSMYGLHYNPFLAAHKSNYKSYFS